MPIHKKAFAYIAEAAMHGKPGIDFAFGEGSNPFDLLSKDPVGGLGARVSDTWLQMVPVVSVVLQAAK
jgi:hypothetical protein